MVQILSVRIAEAGAESDITDLRWYNPENGILNTASLPAMITFLHQHGRAYVCDGKQILEVHIVGVAPNETLRIINENPDGCSLTSLPHF